VIWREETAEKTTWTFSAVFLFSPVKRPFRQMLHFLPFIFNRCFSFKTGSNRSPFFSILLSMFSIVKSCGFSFPRFTSPQSRGVEIPDDAAEKISTVKDAITYIDEHKG